MSDQAAFLWGREKESADQLTEWLEQCMAKNGDLAQLDRDLQAQTSTRLFDWIDHFCSPEDPPAGFVDGHHPRAQLPWVYPGEWGASVSVDSIADYLMAHRLSRPIEGQLFGPFRRALISESGGVRFWVVERRGTREIEPSTPAAGDVERYLLFHERWMSRSRTGCDLGQTLELADETVAALGQGRAASLVLEVERAYWQQRNRAAQLQKSRQDRLGMGWANHDHHTFRSSRHLFTQLVDLFERLGFSCRERFYAGEEAGWGAQVMENSESGLICFLDLDLSPEEVAIDFAHEPLEEREDLGTIGLWCALHGDSILESGMHHLEGQFLFDQLRADLAESGVGMMQPFSNESYLRQAFTEGERWRVDPARLEQLVESGQITQAQADHFAKEGAVGSHLENLQREEGFKGFNQKNVSYIIKETDPRRL